MEPQFYAYRKDREVCVEESDDGFESSLSLTQKNRTNKSNKIETVKKKWSKFIQIFSSKSKKGDCEIPFEECEDTTKQEQKHFNPPRKGYGLILKDGHQLEFENEWEDNDDSETIDTYSTNGTCQDASCATTGEWTIETLASIEWENITSLSKAGTVASKVAQGILIILCILILIGLYVLLL